AGLARDRLGIAELDRPFEIGDRVVAADRAVDARGDEVKPLQPSADLGAAVVVVELKVSEASLLALLERRGPGVERHAVQAIVDLARLRGRRRDLPRPPPRIEPGAGLGRGPR